jgi:hypothetical protein
MMRARRYAKLLGAALLVSLPLVAGCGESISCEPGSRLERLEVSLPADEAMSFRLARCRVDVDACLELCELTRPPPFGAADPPELGSASLTPELPLETCDVEFFDDRVEVAAEFLTFEDDTCGVGFLDR